MNPSFISVVDGFHVVFPLFLFVGTALNRNGKTKNAAIEEASSLSEKFKLPLYNYIK